MERLPSKAKCGHCRCLYQCQWYDCSSETGRSCDAALEQSRCYGDFVARSDEFDSRSLRACMARLAVRLISNACKARWACCPQKGPTRPQFRRSSATLFQNSSESNCKRHSSDVSQTHVSVTFRSVRVVSVSRNARDDGHNICVETPPCCIFFRIVNQKNNFHVICIVNESGSLS